MSCKINLVCLLIFFVYVTFESIVECVPKAKKLM